MDKPVSQVLEEAAGLLAKPGGWTQEEYARNERGFPTRYKEQATCFCAVGAIDAASGAKEIGDEVDSEAIGLVTAAATGDRIVCITRWNDVPERTQAEVVDAFRRAAALAKEQGR